MRRVRAAAAKVILVTANNLRNIRQYPLILKSQVSKLRKRYQTFNKLWQKYKKVSLVLVALVKNHYKHLRLGLHRMEDLITLISEILSVDL